MHKDLVIHILSFGLVGLFFISLYAFGIMMANVGYVSLKRYWKFLTCLFKIIIVETSKKYWLAFNNLLTWADKR